MTEAANNWVGIPGGDLITQGLADLGAARVTEHALLVLVGRPRLQRLGIQFPAFRPELSRPVEHALYDLLCDTRGHGATAATTACSGA